MDGDRAAAIAQGAKQISDTHTDACVANGPAYGEGFGLVGKDGNCTPVADKLALFEALEKLIGA